MPEALVIRLLSTHNSGATPEQTRARVQWTLVDAQGARVGAVLQGSLQEASGLAQGRRVLALVAGTEVLHAEPVLPPLKSGAKLAQIVPFALEDQLASDVDDLHFAVGKRTGRPGTPVAVVAHHQVQLWLSELEDVGLHPTALYTDTSIAPGVTDGVVLLIDQGRVTLRRNNEPAISLDVKPLAEALQLLLPDEPNQATTVYIAESEYDRDQAALEALRERVADLQIKLLPDGVLPLLAVQAVKHDALNLLQGVYAPATNVGTQFKPWRYAALLVATLFVLHIVGSGVQWWQLKQKETELDRQITQAYAQGLPGAAPVSPAQARRAFESQLSALQSGGVNSQLMQNLGTLADALSKTPNTQINALAYRDGNVDLQVTAPNVPALDQIRQLAATHGVAAEIQSANPRDNKIEGRLRLTSLTPGKGR
jgi:general secretion pathway protein L